MNKHPHTNGKGAQPNGAPARRTIGLWTATALVVGNMIGSGVFLLPSSLAAAAGPVQGQVPLAAARDGLFPRRFARLHGERQTPVFGLVVSSVLVSGLLLAGIPIYLWLNWRKRRELPAAPATIPTRLRPPVRAAHEG